MNKIDWKKLLFYVVITFIIGGLFVMFTNNSFYDDLNKPFDVPMIVFPIVWSILFLLMSVSAYMVSEYPNTKSEIGLYFVQLIVNSLWTLIFFGLKQYLFAFIWLLILLALVIVMVYQFYKIKPIAGLLNIPYILWLIFAGYLNYMIYYLN